MLCWYDYKLQYPYHSHLFPLPGEFQGIDHRTDLHFAIMPFFPPPRGRPAFPLIALCKSLSFEPLVFEAMYPIRSGIIFAPSSEGRTDHLKGGVVMTPRTAFFLLLLAAAVNCSGQDFRENPDIYPQIYTPPRPVYRHPVCYPEAARRKGIGGIVILELLIDTNGMPQKVRVTRSVTRLVDKAATEAVLRWRFRPATYYRKPVSGWCPIAFRFPRRGQMATCPLCPGRMVP